MTDWSRLSHAYGSAEDIPALLDQARTDSSAECWHELWSALCHQGTVYPASFAALPRLVTIAADGDKDQRSQALLLAGAIMSGADQPHGGGDVRTMYAAEIADLLRMAGEQRPAVRNRTRYIYLLQGILAFEDVPLWSQSLAWGLAIGKYKVSCPTCETTLLIALGDYGHFSTSSDYALDDNAEKTALRPADPKDLHGIGRRLYDTALADDHPDVAAALTYLFGNASCTECGADFIVADRVELRPRRS